MIDEEAIGERYRALAGELDERRRRLWAAAEARSHGHGGGAAGGGGAGGGGGHRAGGGGGRRGGGAQKPLSEPDPPLVRDLERLVAPDSRGDPELPLRWTAK